MVEVTTAEKLRNMAKQASALGKQLAQAQANATAANQRADRAEQAMRTMDLQFQATRVRLGRAEAQLRSLGATVDGE